MAKIHGRKRRPLPPSLTDGLVELGYRLMQNQTNETDIWFFRHPRKGFYVNAVASNMPGSGDIIIASYKGMPTSRGTVDTLLEHLRAQLERSTQPMEEMQ